MGPQFTYNREAQTIGIYKPHIDQLTIIKVKDLLKFLSSSDLDLLPEHIREELKKAF